MLSEYPPGARPLKHHFPTRNRIIAGLSRAVVVAEAPERSGALITARAAAAEGREVLVHGGPLEGVRSAGCRVLHAEGAIAVHSAADVGLATGEALIDRLAPATRGDAPPAAPMTTTAAGRWLVAALRWEQRQAHGEVGSSSDDCGA